MTRLRDGGNVCYTVTEEIELGDGGMEAGRDAGAHAWARQPLSEDVASAVMDRIHEPCCRLVAQAGWQKAQRHMGEGPIG